MKKSTYLLLIGFNLIFSGWIFAEFCPAEMDFSHIEKLSLGNEVLLDDFYCMPTESSIKEIEYLLLTLKNMPISLYVNPDIHFGYEKDYWCDYVWYEMGLNKEIKEHKMRLFCRNR